MLADELKVAVASNFVSTMRVIAGKFESQTGHRLLLSSGSSGKHYAQIKHGAPFDVFFSADSLRVKRLEQEGYYEVVLGMTVTSKMGEKTAFLTEVQQAGVFHIQGIPKEDLPLALEIACPNVLLPFAREAISDLVGKAGFPQLLLSPINFEALFHQKLKSEAEAKKQAAEEENKH